MRGPSRRGRRRTPAKRLWYTPSLWRVFFFPAAACLPPRLLLKAGEFLLPSFAGVSWSRPTYRDHPDGNNRLKQAQGRKKEPPAGGVSTVAGGSWRTGALSCLSLASAMRRFCRCAIRALQLSPCPQPIVPSPAELVAGNRAAGHEGCVLTGARGIVRTAGPFWSLLGIRSSQSTGVLLRRPVPSPSQPWKADRWTQNPTTLWLAMAWYAVLPCQS